MGNLRTRLSKLEAARSKVVAPTGESDVFGDIARYEVWLAFRERTGK
jgi:hypothetical protein